MDATHIDLPGSSIKAVTVDGEAVRIVFEPAILIKTMTGSVERTRWWQNGELELSGASVLADLPPLPAVCRGGDVGENVYTYRDMIPLPLESRGRAHCELRVEGSDLAIRVAAHGVRMVMRDVPRYIEHIRSK